MPPATGRRRCAGGPPPPPLRGTITLYAGEEIGEEDAVDLPGPSWDRAGRDAQRTPMQWDATEQGGFTDGQPWLPVTDAATRNVAAQDGDSGSVLNHYRRLIALRRSSPALRHGRQRAMLDVPGEVIAWTREAAGERLLILGNMGATPELIARPELAGADILLGTDVSRSGTLVGDNLTLAPGEGLILRLRGGVGPGRARAAHRMTRRPPPPDPDPRDPIDPLLEVREKRRGKRMGDAYVKIVRPFEDSFERGDEAGTLVASERTVLHRSGWTALLRQIRTTLIGRPISTDHEAHERLSKTKALAIFSSDNISSSAYGPGDDAGARHGRRGGHRLDAAAHDPDHRHARDRRDVVPADDRGLPTGASSYIVASDNLRSTTSIDRSSAVTSIGYVVTVAVSISAGVAALTSIYPFLFTYKVELAVGSVILLTIGNLRGIRESGTLFMAPTYLYIAVIGGLIGWGWSSTRLARCRTTSPRR